MGVCVKVYVEEKRDTKCERNKTGLRSVTGWKDGIPHWEWRVKREETEHDFVLLKSFTHWAYI